jgi:two-component system, cell cycle sensor histidine kinase and response regulator CckA
MLMVDDSMNTSCSDTDENSTLSALLPLDDEARRLRAAISLLEAAGYSVAAGSNPAQEALRDSEQRYRAIVTAFDGYIYVCSPDYRITFMNEALIKCRGNAIGAHCYQALHDLDAVCPWCVNERVFRGEVVRWEVQSPKDGRWYYSVNSPINHPDGTVSKQAMIHDITHLKLAQSELKFKSFTLDNLAEEIVWLSAEGRILDVNQVACAKLGYSREELLSLSDRDINPLHQDELEWDTLKKSGSLRFESLRQTKDGQVYPVEITANYLNHDGVEYNCSIVRDITERKTLEKALLESEKQFRSLSDSAPIGIFKSDSQGNCTYFNPRWGEITGLSASQGMGKGWRDIIHPDDLEELTQAWSQAAASGSTYCHEHRHVTPQGKTLWVRVLANPIRGEQGAILGHVGTLEDITGLRQARKEILKAQKLESIGILAGGIAHDFNNILTAILGNISLAAYQMDEPEKVAQRLEEAESAASRAKDLTQQLLTFARGGEPVKKIIEVPGVLKEAVAFALHGSNVGCIFEIADGVWPLEADQGQFIQVIHNLVLNAVQSMPEGGTVTVGAHNESSREQGGDFVEIFITDSGMGISEQHLEKIFDPYFTTKRQGSGLGLASCYSIINKHGGTLKAESVVEQGSTFRIQLPASKRHQVAQAKAGTRMIPGNSRVLVMDDEEIVRVLAKAVLEQLGYQAQCVENGTQAVEVYRKAMEEGTPFAAVILDLTVPGGVGGKEAIRMLLALDPRVKAIVCSGYSTDPVMSSYREHGFSAVLSKPYRPHDLSGVLQELLGN